MTSISPMGSATVTAVRGKLIAPMSPFRVLPTASSLPDLQTILRLASLRITALTNQALAPMGMNVGHYSILSILDLQREPLDEDRIAHLLQIPPMEATTLIVHLVDHGYIERKIVSRPSRMVTIELTTHARRCLPACAALIAESTAQTYRDYTDLEVTEYKRWLARLAGFVEGEKTEKPQNIVPIRVGASM